MNTTGDPARVLVVDDAEDAREMLVAHLRLQGFEAEGASDGQEALRAIERLPPHCVILDIQMPGMDGLELARMLRQRFHDDIVLIAVTGRPPNDAPVVDTFNLVDHYLRKPVNLCALRKALSGAER